jgi:hypothetical protein
MVFPHIYYDYHSQKIQMSNGCHYIYNMLLSLWLRGLRSYHKCLCNFGDTLSNCLSSFIYNNIIFYFAAAVAVVATVGETTAVVVVVVGRVATETAGIGGVVGVVLIGALLSDGLTAKATSNIVVVSTEIKVSEVITQLHIWQSPDVKQSMLYIHKMTKGTVISV